MPQASPSDFGHKELTPSLRPYSPGQICTPPFTNNTKLSLLAITTAFGGSRCDSNHAPRPCTYHFLKILKLFPGDFSYSFDRRQISTDSVSHHLYLPSSPFSDNLSHIFSKFITVRLILAETNLSRPSTQNYYKQPKVQIISITQTSAQCMNQI